MSAVGRPGITLIAGKSETKEKWHELENYRQSLGWTQTQMASLLGVSRGTYSARKHKTELPVKWWERFEELRDKPQQRVTASEAQRLIDEGRIHVTGNAGEAQKVIVVTDYEGLVNVNGTVETVRADPGDVRYCKYKPCGTAFIKHSWNHEFCEEECRRAYWRGQRKVTQCE